MGVGRGRESEKPRNGLCIWDILRARNVIRIHACASRQNNTTNNKRTIRGCVQNGTAVCKTVRKSVVERNKPCYNDVDFCNNTFVHEDGNMR